MGITSDYVDFCLSLKYADLPAEVIEAIKPLGLDFIGTAAYGRLENSSKTMLSFIQSLKLWGDCTVIGTRTKYPEYYAALANGTFVKPNELDDVETSASLHPGAAVWPVILALGEKYHLDGKKLLTSAVLGYETIIRLGQAINAGEHYKRGFHPSSTCGHFAAAVAASKLLNLNKQQMIDALGIAGSQTSGSFRYIVAGSWTKAFHSGWAAHSGILAAYLAQKGFNAPTDFFEAQYGFLQSYSQDTYPELILKDLGKVYQTVRTGIKIHTACRAEHPALDAVLAIVRENDLKPQDIHRADIYMIEHAFKLVVEPEEAKRAPKNIVDAMHSVYFGAAMAILKRRAFIEEHREKWLNAPEVHNLIKRTYVHHDPELDKLRPEKDPARAIIYTNDGRKLEKFVEVPHGDGLRDPISMEELRGKYEPLARRIFSKKRVQEIEKKIMSFEKVRDFREVAGLLGREGGK
ncbi:MAG: MmgE/PrpD family protein [Deltaproteobacteria bacterium]|nr:MmgE/PrpD family protein [Deltaproteobacteria bacterium]